jgi:phosphatidylglycerol:prolipoprotein diacylglycerol transferase
MEEIMIERFLNWWQYIPRHLDPVAFKIGGFQLSYYALAYIFGFAVTYFLVLYRLKNEKLEYSVETVQEAFLCGSLAALIGGRLGYVVLHDFRYYMANPLMIVCPFDPSNGFRYTGISGMAYYGAVIGVIIVSIIFCRMNKIRYLRFMDLFTPAIPIGYTLGRIANFINGEFYGRVTNCAWGMYFPSDPIHALRHPSQLYEAFFEGIVLFIILWSLRKKKYFDGFISGLYIVGYGIFRFFVEFARQPDHISGLIFGVFSIGQLFCVLMAVSGIAAMLIIRSADTRGKKIASPQGRC